MEASPALDHVRSIPGMRPILAAVVVSEIDHISCQGAVGGVFCDTTNAEISEQLLRCAESRYRPGTSMDCK